MRVRYGRSPVSLGTWTPTLIYLVQQPLNMAILTEPKVSTVKESCGACGECCEPNTGCPGSCSHHNASVVNHTTRYAMSERIVCEDCGFWEEVNSMSIYDIKCY